jgi:sec-independent protein translocase protein TatA
MTVEFFGMGGGEILFILIIALLIFGPKKIVDISKTLGKIMHDLKKATSDLTTQISREAEEKVDKPSTKLNQEAELGLGKGAIKNDR